MAWMRPRALVRRTIAIVAAYALAAQGMAVALAVPALDLDPAGLCRSAGAPTQSTLNQSTPSHAPASDHSDCNACAIACGTTPALVRGDGVTDVVAPAMSARVAHRPTAVPWRPAIPRAGLARAPPIAV